MISIETSLTKKDVARARLSWYFRSTFGRVVSVLFLGYFVLSIIQVVTGREENARSNAPITAFLGLLPVGVVLAGLNSVAVKRMTDGPVTYTLSGETLRVETRQAAATFAGRELTSVQETGRYFIILAGGVLQIIPKQDVPPESINELRDILRGLLENRARRA